MFRKCFLETNGYRIFFNLKSTDKPKADFVDSIIEFQLDPNLGEVLVRSVPGFIHFKDLQRLIKYFEKHIAALKEDPNSESYTFVTYNLGFQVQALSGRVFSESEGFFTIMFTVNVGQAYKGAGSTYVGGESVVSFASISRFTSSLLALLNELEAAA